MKRFKAIDIIRGLCIILMVGGHLFMWWLNAEAFWMIELLMFYLAPFAATGFILISGVSVSLSYNNMLIRIDEMDDLSFQMSKNVYMIRAGLLLLVGLIFNIGVVIIRNNPLHIWGWTIIQTIAFCLFLAWPLLKVAKVIRIILVFALLILNDYLLVTLYPFMGQMNFYGILYYILYNPLEQFIILSFFPIFLIGTIVGDLLFDLNKIENQEERSKIFKESLIGPLLISGVIIIFIVPFIPSREVLQGHNKISYYSVGIVLIVFTLLIAIEEFKEFKVEKNYRAFFYYSYYSFTIFIAHHLLFFIFFRQLNVYTGWVAVIISVVLLGILMKYMYNKLGPKISLKEGLKIIAFVLATKIEQKKGRT